MLTERLELDDAYLQEWTSPVTWTGDDELVLARSAFYPGGGGQPRDHGWLIDDNTSVRVDCVGMRDGLVILQAAEPVTRKPRRADFRLDWEFRYHCMRLHTAYHCIVGLAWSLYGATVAGGGMSGGRGRIDFSSQIDREGIERVIVEANAAIERGAEVSVDYVPVDETSRSPELVKLIENRAPTTGGSLYRIVEIDGIDKEIDGGTHLSNLSEVGSIVVGKITSAGKGCKRLKFSVAW